MKLLVDIEIKPLQSPLTYRDKILVVGSCFTEHIGGRLADVKFNVLQNPNGILFDPLSVASSLQSYISNKHFTDKDLILLNDVWHSWQHHSRFSGVDKQKVLIDINQSQQAAHHFLRDATWMIITLGSAFSYQHVVDNKAVANCHKAPAQTFNKKLVTIKEIIDVYTGLIKQLHDFNPALNILFTISPVRHIRDGVVENNRSKARLIEAVHTLVGKYHNVHYFPAYELVIDVLRDYRFYDIDLVHPNYAATEFVFEKFVDNCVDESSEQLMDDIKKIIAAYKHKPFHPSSEAHKKFLAKMLQQATSLQHNHPYISFENELNFFKKEIAESQD